MYWMPEMHENLCKTRFPIASKLCSNKRFSKSISSVYKLVENQTKRAKFFRIKLRSSHSQKMSNLPLYVT